MSENYEDILSYRPDIKYTKESSINYKSSEYNIDPTKEYDDNFNVINHSQVIKDLLKYPPSDIYADILDVVSNIKDYLYNIESEFSSRKVNDTTMGKYFAQIKSKEIVVEEQEEIINDKYQNSVLEVYSELNSELENLQGVKDTFTKINYFDEDITLEKSSEIDNSFIKKIKEYEGAKANKINYFNLSLDSKINMLLQGYVEAIHIYTQDMYYLLFMDRKHKAPNNEIVEKGLSETFKDLSSYNLSDLKKLTNIKKNSNVEKILKHINNAKVDGNILLDTKDELSFHDEDFAMYVDNVFDRKVKEIDQMILDLFKEISLQCSYKDDYLDTLIKKEYLRKVFLEF